MEEKTQGQSSEKISIVAAIDFGTTFSGCAFSWVGDLDEIPPRVFGPQWNAPSAGLVSLKTPTTLLLDSNQDFVEFGYEAEELYAQYAEEESHEDYYYFRRFKMMLYDKTRRTRLTTATKIADIRGKEMLAVDVFEHSIRYLKGELMKLLESKGEKLNESQIRWVLTVPAIWDDPAKQFMRKAATKAGIDGKNLMVALEPEAASVYCQHIPVEKLEGVENAIGTFEDGSRYLVLDAGGGTIDITVHEVISKNRLRELHKASGGDLGGICVEGAYEAVLADLVGADRMKKYCQTHTAGYIEMFRDFEMKKRKDINDADENITLLVAETFLDEFKDIKKRSEESNYSSNLKWVRDKVRIDIPTYTSFYESVCSGIISQVKSILESPKVHGTNNILMVGGFSESSILQNAIREAFTDCRIIIPKQAGLAVLYGAVIYGKKPEIIESRIAKFTYGIETNVKFSNSFHDVRRKVLIDGEEYCSKVFDKHVCIGDTLSHGVAQTEKVYNPVRANQTKITFSVFKSENNSVRYVDEKPSSQYLGTLSVDIPDVTGGKDREILVKIMFGGTEITVEATVVKTGIITSAEFDFLDDEP